MSRFFPHTPYAEDQPLSHTILTTHVLTRAVTLGTIVGMAAAAVRQCLPGLPAMSSSTFAKRPAAPLDITQPPFPKRLLVFSSHGVVAVTALTSAGLVARMWGREPVEWQDRSWRLLENRGQVETDDWTYAGMGVALAAVAFRSKSGPAKLGWRGIVGAVGMGSVGGTVGYLAWRYGINNGKFVDKDNHERSGI